MKAENIDKDSYYLKEKRSESLERKNNRLINKMTKIIPLNEKKIWHCPKCNADLDCSDNLDIAQAIKRLKARLSNAGDEFAIDMVNQEFGEFENETKRVYKG